LKNRHRKKELGILKTIGVTKSNITAPTFLEITESDSTSFSYFSHTVRYTDALDKQYIQLRLHFNQNVLCAGGVTGMCACCRDSVHASCV